MAADASPAKQTLAGNNHTEFQVHIQFLAAGTYYLFARYIDAALDNDKYEQTKTAIRAIKEITNVRFLKVTKHNPELPHNASGYVKKYEAKHPNSEKKDVKVGRQDNSPGFNPWG